MNEKLEKKYEDFKKLLHSDSLVKKQGQEQQIKIKEFENFSDYIKEKYLGPLPKKIKIFMKIKLNGTELKLTGYDIRQKKIIIDNKQEEMTIKNLLEKIGKEQKPIFLHHLKNQILTRININKISFPEITGGIKFLLEDQ